jgi:tRNA(fMet)-specific endonuclease VapC
LKRYLIDTNICIYAMKGQFPALKDKLLTVRPEQIKISAVTRGELAYGAAKSKWGERTKTAYLMFLSSFDVLPFTEKDAEVWGQIRGYLASQGTPIGAYDCMIAAQGIQRDLIVVTHNTKEFSRVPGIRLEDWVI